MQVLGIILLAIILSGAILWFSVWSGSKWWEELTKEQRKYLEDHPEEMHKYGPFSIQDPPIC